ncbi:MAG: ABC transporter permease [Candidatus Lernaella stagnicola]|nr:ABC transporter permease [Candidatus Lernaella stagnicola]
MKWFRRKQRRIHRRISLIENLRIALRSIRSNKMRTGLTSLGIIIGVATVIAMMSVVGGIDNVVTSEFSRLGADVFFIQKYPAIAITFDWNKYRRRPDLTMEDAHAIQRKARLVDMVSPFVYRWRGDTIRAEGRKTDPDVGIAAATETYLPVTGMNLDGGRNFTPHEVLAGTRVAVVGYDVLDRLFPYGNPVGRFIRVRGDRFRIVGVAERQGAVFGDSRDNFVAIPLGAFTRKWKIRDQLQIHMKAKQDVPVDMAIEEVRAILRIRHKLKLTEADDFEIETRESMMSSYNSLTGSIFIAAIGIAMISLLVGGIGIMNIMLVSVRERTREIGVRKALGARRRDISRQFLIEAVTLSLLGGLIGIGLAVGGLLLVGKFVDSLPITIAASSIVLAVSFSVGTGVFFGVYPARKAAKLDPIEALRYE